MTARRPIVLLRSPSVSGRTRVHDLSSAPRVLIMPVPLGDQKIHFRYALVPVGRLQPSHLIDESFQPVENPDYQEIGAQGRVYSEFSQASGALAKAAKAPRVDFLLDLTGTATFGPPIVVAHRGEYYVVAGHQRAAILRYQAYKPSSGFWRDYYDEIKAVLPELARKSVLTNKVVVRIIDVHIRDEKSLRIYADILFQLNLLSDTPLTKGRDQYAVARSLSGLVASNATLLRAVLGLIPARVAESTSKDQPPSLFDELDSMGGEESSEEDSGVAIKRGEQKPKASLRAILEKIGRRIDPDRIELLRTELFEKKRRYSFGEDRQITLPVLSKYEEASFFRWAGDQAAHSRRIDLTPNGRQAFAYLWLSVALGGHQVVERLAEARMLHVQSGGNASTAPGRYTLLAAQRAYGQLREGDSLKVYKRIVDRLAAVMLTELATARSTIVALEQQSIGRTSERIMQWAPQAVSGEGLTSLSMLKSDAAQWTDAVITWARKADLNGGQSQQIATPFVTQQVDPALVKATERILQIASNDSFRDVSAARGHAIARAILSFQAALPKRLGRSPREKNRGRPRSHTVDYAFTAFLLIRQARVSIPRKVLASARLRHFVKSEAASEAFASLYRNLGDMIGDTYSMVGFRSWLNENPEAYPSLNTCRMPTLVSLRRLSAWLEKLGEPHVASASSGQGNADEPPMSEAQLLGIWKAAIKLPPLK